MTLTTAAPTAEFDFLGNRVRVLAEPDGPDALGTVEMLAMPAGDMPPLHVHHDQDEVFLLHEGELTLYLPGREIALSPGEFAVAPRGIPHAYRVGDAGARSTVTSSPAGFERFVLAVAALDEVDPAALTATAADFGIEILGPPGTRP